MPLSGQDQRKCALAAAQYQAVQNGAITTSLAASVTAGKVKNARNVLMRSAREAATPEEEALLRKSADVQADALFHLKTPRDADHVRGLEGEAAAAYFDVFTLMMKPAERDSGRARIETSWAAASAAVAGEAPVLLDGRGLKPRPARFQKPGRSASKRHYSPAYT